VSIPYCTNVHAGASLEENLAALETHAVAVRERLGEGGLLPIGWWLSAAAIVDLSKQPPGKFDRLRDWFISHGLLPVTINAFPLGNFHGPRVKHDAYKPDWAQPSRLALTKVITTLMAALSSPGADRSVSTLPIGWPSAKDEEVVRTSVGHLLDLVEHLRKLRDTTKVRIHVDLEPEPGCIIQRSDDLVRFFNDHLLPEADRRGVPREAVLEHLGVCHDVCHAAVMFESQADAIGAYRDAGISIGKLQLSSAIALEFDAMAIRERDDTLTLLEAFAEGRYLHQTMVRSAEGLRSAEGELKFFEDLPEAIAAGRSKGAHGSWRIHFHVPIHKATVGESGVFGTTQKQIVEAMSLIDQKSTTIEVETYAWNVLPEALRPDDLASGIADELRWADKLRLTGRMPAGSRA